LGRLRKPPRVPVNIVRNQIEMRTRCLRYRGFRVTATLICSVLYSGGYPTGREVAEGVDKLSIKNV
jgi:hypothetical protein